MYEDVNEDIWALTHKFMELVDNKAPMDEIQKFWDSIATKEVAAEIWSLYKEMA